MRSLVIMLRGVTELLAFLCFGLVIACQHAACLNAPVEIELDTQSSETIFDITPFRICRGVVIWASPVKGETSGRAVKPTVEFPPDPSTSDTDAGCIAPGVEGPHLGYIRYTIY